MKDCAICSGITSGDPAVLFIGTRGTRYVICPSCEKKLDNLFSETDSSEKMRIKGEIVQVVESNKLAGMNVELMSFITKLLEESESKNEENTTEQEVLCEEDTLGNSQKRNCPKIEFAGELSDQTRKYILLRDFKQNLLIDLIIMAIFLPLAILLGPSALSYLILFSLLVVSVFIIIPPSKKTQAETLPTSIVIEDGIMVVTTPRQRVVKSVSDVEKVLDTGYLYHILFIASEKTQLFVCQKDLLVTGTIEDFEHLFEDMIVKTVKSS